MLFIDHVLTDRLEGERTEVSDAGGPIQLIDRLQRTPKAHELRSPFAVVALGELKVLQDQLRDRQIGIENTRTHIVVTRTRLSGQFGDEPGVSLTARRRFVRAEVDVASLGGGLDPGRRVCGACSGEQQTCVAWAESLAAWEKG